ncbi:MAG: chromate resistance protein [Pseudomonadota bacterium]|nr:chromate resistance protein [Pseudomonadota bacterium]
MTSWLLLTATLPTSPSALRVRTWRALKSTGAGALRDGVYLLPASAPTAGALWDIERLILAAGAEAHMLLVEPRDVAQKKAFLSLFDRTGAYADLLQSLKEARSRVKHATEAVLHRNMRALEQQLHAIQAIDFFPAKTSERAANALATLRREIELQLSPGEPSPGPDTVRRQEKSTFKGRTWATRKRPWVDRLATAWLVRRRIDPKAKFIWIESARKCPKSAVGFDFDGATFSHIGDQVTYEVVLHSFGLEADAGLKRLGELVHFIDIGGIPVDAAPGVEAVVRGLLVQHEDDDRVLTAALPVFDALYAALASEP